MLWVSLALFLSLKPGQLFCLLTYYSSLCLLSAWSCCMMVSPGGGSRVGGGGGPVAGEESSLAGTGAGAAGESFHVDLEVRPVLGTLQPIGPN